MRSEDQFSELLMQNQERLFAYVFSWLRDNADTQDVLQQTATVLWEKFDTFDLETDFFRWAVVVAKYQTLNFLRYRRKHRAHFSHEFMDGLAAEELLADNDLEESRQAALKSCLQKLSDSDRNLLRSRYNSGMRLKQLADLFGRSSSSISNSLRRIRSALLNCIEKTIDREGL